MTTGYRAPLGAEAVWTAVMRAAGYRCQCAGGLCGSQHSVSGLRCDRTPERGRLLVAPLDLTLTQAAAVAVPTAELRAWCLACHDKARARQRAHDRQMRRQLEPEPEALF
ncbi:hypothetical protein ACIRD2_33435 [Streptomyces sp. NPDC093595]|uniref:hypothetical protein n=1 Tax=Streptomyces sp. NPDC093595 TaxID=3366045 RepID=UPI0037F9987A